MKTQKDKCLNVVADVSRPVYSNRPITASRRYRPSGTHLPSGLDPALKRWAILGCPSGTNWFGGSHGQAKLKSCHRGIKRYSQGILKLQDPNQVSTRPNSVWTNTCSLNTP